MAINQDKVARFKAANAASPVVYGSVLSSTAKGVYYRLKDGSKFRLNGDECEAIGYPRWAIDEVPA